MSLNDQLKELCLAKQEKAHGKAVSKFSTKNELFLNFSRNFLLNF